MLFRHQTTSLIVKILDLLSPQERRRAWLLLGMILVMAMLANPQVVETNAYLAAAYAALGFTAIEPFLFFLGVMVFVALVLSISFKALTTWALTHFTQMRNYSLSMRLVAGYLHQPYEWFLNRHSADLGKNVLVEVQQIITGALIPLMQSLAQGAVVLAILSLLLAVDPLLALFLGLGLGIAYGGIYAALRQRLTRAGKARLAANLGRFQVLTEAFGGIKEVKIAGLEQAFLDRFESPAYRFARTQVIATVIGQMPRQALEIIAFGGMLLVVLYLMRTAQGLQGALPIIALYAFAGYRLMPALQQLYTQSTQLRFAGPALDSLHQDLRQLAHVTVPLQEDAPLALTQAIRLSDLSYRYPQATHPAVHDLTLDIPARATVGLVGTTGSGKTTTVDIILGLLLPQSGQLLIDGVPLTVANRRAWQGSLGYVPQQIYLADDSVAANIAFGIPPDRIDQGAVERAARIAKLHDFVSQELPQGYATLVGERGVRLSGGQRQRIGIARALYHQPQVLILDEATTALDNLTEQAVMDAVHALGHEITIILIAHRLSTVRECDRIYLLDKGRLANQGTYEELLAASAHFRVMAQATLASQSTGSSGAH